MTGADPALEEGWVDRELALEFPELRLVSATAPAPGRRTPSAQRERLALLAEQGRLRLPVPRVGGRRINPQRAPTG